MIGKSLYFRIVFGIVLMGFPMCLIAQDTYTVESWKKWTLDVESERAPIEIIHTCEPGKGIVPICGIHSPEDLAVTPSGKWVLFGEIGRNAIGAMRTSDHSVSRIYHPATGSGERNSWGAQECAAPPGPDEFTPLGMDLTLLNSGEMRLLVVNMGRRSSIEFFEISESPEKVEAVWRGCVRFPSGINGNSVATIPTGGFVATTMGTLQAGEERIKDLERIVKGEPFGKVLEWTPGQGWRELAAGHISAPNGILVSADSRTVYFASVGTNEVIRMNRIGEKTERKTVPMPKVDNLRWTKDGKILAASLRGSSYSLFRDCAGLKSGSCGQAFAVVEIDPGTLFWKELVHNEGSPMGLVTSAVKIGNRIYMGTAYGDRIAYKDLPR